MNRPILLLAGALLAVACSDNSVAPPTLAPTSTDSQVLTSRNAARGFAVYRVQLAAPTGSASTAIGRLRVFVGLPPNPITPPNPICEAAPSGTYVVVCGAIRNPDGEAFSGGTLTLKWTRAGESVVLNFAAPPNPVCPRYAVRAATSVRVPAPGPPDVEVALQTSAGGIVGVGIPNPGPPGRPARRPAAGRGASARGCTITFASR